MTGDSRHYIQRPIERTPISAIERTRSSLGIATLELSSPLAPRSGERVGERGRVPAVRVAYWDVQPPSTTIAWPVMLRAAGETKNAVIPASSSMPMNTPLGIGLSMISPIT